MGETSLTCDKDFILGSKLSSQINYRYLNYNIPIHAIYSEKKV